MFYSNRNGTFSHFLKCSLEEFPVLCNSPCLWASNNLQVPGWGSGLSPAGPSILSTTNTSPTTDEPKPPALAKGALSPAPSHGTPPSTSVSSLRTILWLLPDHSLQGTRLPQPSYLPGGKRRAQSRNKRRVVTSASPPSSLMTSLGSVKARDRNCDPKLSKVHPSPTPLKEFSDWAGRVMFKILSLGQGDAQGGRRLLPSLAA